MALFSWLSGRSDKASRLLADYADECFVHAGAPGALPPEQRDRNLGAFIASIDRRISRLQALAAALGTTLPVPTGDRSMVGAIREALDHLGKSRLSGLAGVGAAFAMDWRASEPQGQARQLQTLVIDLGAYCGEVGIRCAPRYQWVIDETRYTPRTVMRTSGRVVIGHHPAVMARAMNNPVDVIDMVAFALTEIVNHRHAKGLWRPNYFHFLTDLADGRYS